MPGKVATSRTPATRRETVEARRQLFGRLIVDVELYHKDRIACRFRRSETENPQHVGNARELPAASAHAGRDQFSGRSVAAQFAD